MKAMQFVVVVVVNVVLLCGPAFGAVPPKLPAKPAKLPAPLAAPLAASKPAAPIVPAKGVACDVTKCNGFVAKYYKEIGCKPVLDGNACCPTRFECPAASRRTPDTCQLKSVAYKPGANIPNGLTGPCTKDCICKKFSDVVNIHCLTTECKEVPENCIPIFKENGCCATSFHCKNSTKVDAASKKDFTCAYEGKTYLEGERLLNPVEPCKTCTCQKGFDGTLGGAWCREKSCDLELLHGRRVQRGCAPVFYGLKECCPASWRCPAATDKVIPAKKTVPPTSTEPAMPRLECAFGGLKLNVDDKLSPAAEEEECSCQFPPHVTCDRKEVAFDLDLIDLQ